MSKLAIQRNMPLAPYTTLKIGGPADYLLDAYSFSELQHALAWALKKNLPWYILGGGSNVLISDRGIRGLVIINCIKGWQVISSTSAQKPDMGIASRWHNTFTLKPPQRGKGIIIEVATGTDLKTFLFQLAENQITGLEWFAGIPGTIGGAIKNNIHGGPDFFSQYLLGVQIWQRNRIENYSLRREDFDYDSSPFDSQTVLLKAKLLLFQAEDKRGKLFLQEWGKAKLQNQPQNSAGCIFQNLSAKEQKWLHLPSSSWGYIIDKVLHLKGQQIGGAQISHRHAAFIVNANGKARAQDILALIALIKEKSRRVLGVEPRLEIQLLGFNGK